MAPFFRLNVGHKAVFILVDIDGFHLFDGFLYSWHPLPPFDGRDARSLIVLAAGPTLSCAVSLAELRHVPRSRGFAWRASGLSRSTIFGQTSRNRSMSVPVVFQPMLIRNAHRARSSLTPIAVRTCETDTFPDEQADPDETDTRSRSKAISAVSAEIPGTAKQLVFASRSASSPKIIVDGQMRAQARFQPGSSTPAGGAYLTVSSSASRAATPQTRLIAATFSVPPRRQFS